MKNLANNQKGFTLIELMITVAVVGVLASIAYPSYTEFVAKSRRAQAKTTLSMAQQWMERFYTENYSYYSIRGTSKVVTDIFPIDLKQSPSPGEGAIQYDIAVTVDKKTPEVFILGMTRKSGGSMASDRCGGLEVDQYGRKTPKNYDTNKFSSDKAALDYCWK